jgi:hypothetical protein
MIKSAWKALTSNSNAVMIIASAFDHYVDKCGPTWRSTTGAIAATGGPDSHGALPGAGQFGTLTIHDGGTGPVTVELADHDWTGQTLVSYRFVVGP